MDTKKINLFVYDGKENFEKSKQFLGQFKDIICIEKVEDLDKYFDTTLLSDDEYVYLVIHAFAFDGIKGIRTFLTSGIPEKYPNIGRMYISDGVEATINHKMIDEKLPIEKVFKYHEVYSNLSEDKFKVYTKKEIIEFSKVAKPNSHSIAISSSIEFYDQCDYAIITALEEDEMEKILPMITKSGRVNNDKHLIEFGYVTSKPEKKVVYASQLATGMIDASILATELIIRFRPKFLIMAGVLGGKPVDVKIGDVIVATKVFTIDKGKISEYGFKKEIESSSTDNAFITLFKRNKEKIKSFIKAENLTRTDDIDVHFGAIACMRQVIDLEDFFENNISSIDRKALALEMESYGIARACELVNGGITTALIIKSAMDNTTAKVDDAKTYASWTSAMFVRYILENDLI